MLRLAVRALCVTRTGPVWIHPQPGSGWEQQGVLKAVRDEEPGLAPQTGRLRIPGVHHCQIFQKIFLVLGDTQLTIWTHLPSEPSPRLSQEEAEQRALRTSKQAHETVHSSGYLAHHSKSIHIYVSSRTWIIQAGHYGLTLVFIPPPTCPYCFTAFQLTIILSVDKPHISH